MDDLIDGFTVDDYVRATTSVIFEARNGLMACIGFGNLGLQELHSSHAAFAHVAAALEAAERTYATIKQFDREFIHRKQEVENLESNIPKAAED